MEAEESCAESESNKVKIEAKNGWEVSGPSTHTLNEKC